MKFIEYIYGILVNQNAHIMVQYHRYRDTLSGWKRVKAWLYLFRLNIEYHILKKKVYHAGYEFYGKKKLYMGDSESSLSKRESPEKFAERLAQYDVISFDVFDTLVFRPFSKPTDMFFFVGMELHYLDFERIRIEAEQRAREKKYKQVRSREVTLEEIWEEMELETGIPKEQGMKAEWECELKYCFSNPYMLKVVQELYKRRKKVIIISDMYLGERYIQELLANCGFEKFANYFVSCDYQESKNEGTLYNRVRQSLGEEYNYVHIGDNRISDIRQARERGFDSVLYQNVNETGKQYRAEDMSAINGSVYRGLINSYIHNGQAAYSLSYEYGFIYGGLFVLGYCKWIHDYVQSNQIDKILFLARDGEILSKVYQILYPEENGKWEYVYWSRLAATKMAAKYFKYDFFRRFLQHKTGQDYSIQQIFQSMELEDMLEKFLKSEEAAGITKETVLTEKSAGKIQQYLMQQWEEVLRHYQEQTIAGGQYYGRILNNCRKAVAVDVGWAGSGAVTLNYLVNYEWNLNCEIVGLIAGTNTIYSYEPNTSEPLLYSGQLVSYMFSQEHNRDIWKLHNPNCGHNIYVELLLASGEKSFRKFVGKDSYEFSEGKSEIDSDEVQKGITDFVSYYIERMHEIPNISGRDAFAPIAVLLDNDEWVKQVICSENVQINLE